MMARRSAGQGLADGAIYPETEIYAPPPRSAVHVELMPIDNDDEFKLQTRQHIYRGKVVDFAVMLYYCGENGAPVEISRIDTCHGSVHRHRFHKDQGEVGEPDLIHRILVDGNEWEVVNSHYDAALDLMFREASEFFRRWER